MKKPTFHYISNSIIPSRSANSVHVMKMCEAFSETGYKVTLLAPNRYSEAEETTKNLYDFYGVNKCFSIKKYLWLAIKGKTFIYATGCAYTVWLNSPSIAYGRFLLGCYFSALLGQKVTFELHAAYKKDSFDEKFFLRLLKHKNFNKLVVINQALKRYILNVYPISADRVFVAHDGANIITCTTKKILPNVNKMNIGYIGQLHAGKGVEQIIEISKRCPLFDFHIVGGSKENIMSLQNKHGKLENLHYHGFVSHSETSQYLCAFDILIAPYQNHVSTYGGDINIAQWMSPLKIFEYMSAGKPIISSNLPAIKEILQHGETALLCDPDNIDEWVENIENLKNTQLQKKLGDNAKKRFESTYTWKQRSQSIISAIT